MSNNKTRAIVFSLFVLVAMIITACTQPYSSVPLETPTANPTNLFVSPFPTSDNPMDMIGEFATSTAAAETAVALTQGTPLATEPPVEITPDSATTTEATVDAAATTEVPTLAIMTPTATQPAPTPIVNAPGSYTLQKGEHPFCIARRFNVDPDELLSLSGLTREQAYNLASGTVLTIPKSGKPFPGTRALHNHPDTYTVTSSDETIFRVACYYGDVDPASIVQANNGVSLTSDLTVGQKLNVP